MAKSQKTRLLEIKKMEEKAQEALLRARAEREKVVAPTKGKLTSAFTKVLDAVLAENLDKVVGIRIDIPGFEENLQVLLESFLVKKKETDTAPSTETKRSLEDDDGLLSATIADDAKILLTPNS